MKVRFGFAGSLHSRTQNQKRACIGIANLQIREKGFKCPWRPSQPSRFPLQSSRHLGWSSRLQVVVCIDICRLTSLLTSQICNAVFYADLKKKLMSDI